MKLYNLLLPELTISRLKEHAKEHDLTVSQTVRHAIAFYLWEYGRGFAAPPSLLTKKAQQETEHQPE